MNKFYLLKKTLLVASTVMLFFSIAQAQESQITLTTTKAIGETVSLAINAATIDQPNVWIDLNNNGTKDDGEQVTAFGTSQISYYINSQTITIYGNVTTLYCYGNSLTALDISQNVNLTTLVCYNNSLTTLDVSQNGMLTELQCSTNSLTALDVSKNGMLIKLYCNGSSLTTLDVSQNGNLTTLYCGYNKLTALDVSQNENLTELYCSGNSLNKLDLSQNGNLTELDCFDNHLTALDVSQCGNLTELYCFDNHLTALDVSQNGKLTKLVCYSNLLNVLDLSQNGKLTFLECENNQLKSLNLANGNNTNFIYPTASSTPAVNATGNPSLTCIQVDNGFDPTGLTGNKSWKKDEWAVWNNDPANPCGSAAITSINLSVNYLLLTVGEQQTITATVKPFNAMLPQWNSDNTSIATVDKYGTVTAIAEGTANITAQNGDGTITTTCPINVVDPNDIQITLTTSRAAGETIGLSINAATADQPNIWIDLDNDGTKDDGEQVTAFGASQTSYTISSQTITIYGNVTEFYCRNYSLTALDVSKNGNLTELECGYNKLTSFDVSKNGNLTELECRYNQLTALDVRQNGKLTFLDCAYNKLTALDVSKNGNLTELGCNSNQLSALDLSQHGKLTFLDCQNNQLKKLNLANGNNANFITHWSNTYPAVDASGNPSLTCIQVDDGFDPTGLTGKQEWRKDEGAVWNNDPANACGSAAITSIYLSVNDLLLPLGGQQTITATVEPFNAMLPQWSSDNTSIATVDKDGTVTAIAVGTATITAKSEDGTITATCAVNVVDPDDIQITLTTAKAAGTAIGLGINAAIAYRPNIWIDLNNNGTKDAGEQVTTFDFLNKTYYTISSQTITIHGNVTNFNCYSNSLTALDVSKNVNLTQLNCNDNQLTALDVSKNRNLTKLYCYSNQLTALDVSKNVKLTQLYCPNNQLKNLNLANDNNARFMSPYSSEPAVNATGNPSLTCIQVDDGFDPTGLTGSKEWKKDAGAAWNNNSSNPCPVYVVSVAFDIVKTNIKIGNAVQLIATINPVDATNKSVTWSSSDEAVATVDANGLVTAKAVGSATITVTTEDGGYTATCEVTVIIPVVSVALDITEISLGIGKTVQLTATVNPENDTNKNVTWSSSDDAVATVDANGLVTAKAAGLATIIVTTEDGGYTTTCEVTVIIPVVSVALDITEISLGIGKTVQLTATVNPENATNKNVTWSSSDDAVATVDANGLVTAQAAGSATITVTTEDGGYTATCELTSAAIPVASVALDITETSLGIGNTVQLTATINPEDATNKNVTWSSSDDAVATVDANGLVTAKAAGSAKVTVTTEDGTITATCAVKVFDPNDIQITLTTTKTIGETVSLGINAATADQSNIWIDLDNDGTQDADEQVTTFDFLSTTEYTINSQTITIYGNVTEFNCLSNSLTALDVSQNGNLTQLYCFFNSLTTLDVSHNGNLTSLDCYFNQLTALDVSHNGKLTSLSCSYNQLTALDVSHNGKLTYIDCQYNKLKSLKLANGNNSNFTYPWGGSAPAVNATNNPSLTCIQVDDGFDPTGLTGNQAWKKDDGAAWNNDPANPCPVYVVNVALDIAETSLEIGKTVQLTATINPEDATNKSVTWSSSDDAVATVDANGLVTAKAAGSATITVTTEDGGYTATCAVSIVPTGIGDNLLAETMFRVYPTIVTTGFTVENTGNVLRAETLTIYNLTGQAVKTEKITDQKQYIDISSYQQGVYILKIGKETTTVIKQ